MTTDQPFREAPKQFLRDGYEFRQVWRRGEVAIYQQKRLNSEEPAAWEVVKLRVGKAHPKDADQSPKELYPSQNDWGVKGWTCLTYQLAREKAFGLLPE